MAWQQVHLYGLDRQVATRIAVLAVLLSVLVFAFGMIYGHYWPQGTIAGVAGITGGILILFVLAAGYAFENDGIAISCLLVFGPTLGWLFHVFVGSTPVPLTGTALLESLLIASFVAVTIGTLGYLFGSELRRELLSQRQVQTRYLLTHLLIGHDRALATWTALRAPLLAPIGFGLLAISEIPATSALETITAGLPIQVGAVLALMALAIAAGYTEGGVLVSWLLVFWPGFGAVSYSNLMASGIRIDGSRTLVGVFGTSFVLAVLVGTVGFLLGLGFRAATGAPILSTAPDLDQRKSPPIQETNPADSNCSN